MYSETKRINPIALIEIYSAKPSLLAKIVLTLIRPFTYWGITRHEYISTTDAHLYDYCVQGNLRNWFFIVSYPIQLLIMLVTCMWDGGLCECYLPNRVRFYWSRFEWTDEESDNPALRTLYENVKKVWERA